MKTIKTKIDIILVREQGRLVYIVTDGAQIKYAWAKHPKSSLEVAKEIQEKWKLAIDAE